MSFHPPITISSAIQKIDFNQFLLPSIQREFVWSSDKIEMLFDSLMQDYPIGSLLLWKVTGENKTEQRFYSILKKYREKYHTHCPEIKTAILADFEAVLDGQQRLTALYLGLKGSYAYKRPNYGWKDNQHSLPDRHMYLKLNALAGSDDEMDQSEDGRMYDFKFLSSSDLENLTEDIWFPVSKILEIQGTFKLNQFLKENGWADIEIISNTLSKLHDIVHVTPNIHYYLETDQDYTKALNIFIRINSGGEKLDYSDLIMSTTIASWKQKDARKEINNLIAELWSSHKYELNKDLILRTYLILFSDNIKFRVHNFSVKNAKEFESNWDDIRAAIVEAFQVVADFGYSEHSMTSKNAILPLIQYIYQSCKTKGFSTKVTYEADRKQIKKWLHAVLLHRIFGGQAEGVLKVIRDVISDQIKEGTAVFPAKEIAERLSRTRKSISVDDEFINNLLHTHYEDRYAFPILALLYPQLDYKNGDFHKDHLHPNSWFGKRNLKKHGIAITTQNERYYTDKDCYNAISNLQLLDGNLNKSKGAKSLKEWVTKEKVDKSKQLIPDILDFKDFPKFIDKRRKLLKAKLKAELTF
jgi:uncharacterized protein with ParB-like and HNH nuclease domain